MDVSGPRADLAGLAAGQGAGAMDGHHRPAYRLYRPGRAGQEARPRRQDPPERAFCSLDQRIYGHRTRRNLAVLAAERGDNAEAAKLWAEVLAECPGDREALTALERLKPVSTGR